MLINEVELKQRFDDVTEKFKRYLRTLRTGRPNLDAINGIKVEYYGSQMQLNFIAQISLDATTATIKLNDKSAADKVKEALEEASLGNIVQAESGVFKINFPPLTEDVRKETVKQMYKELEESYRAHARRIRQEFREELKNIEKAPEDIVKKEEEKIQELLNECIKDLDNLAKTKESEIMSV